MAVYYPKNVLVISLFLLYVVQGIEAIPKKSPSAKLLPGFVSFAHGVRSGNVIIKDTRTILIKSLYYDGAGPDAYFWVGTGSKPHAGGRKIPNEQGSMDVLTGYVGQDVELILPADLTVNDIDWLSMWCVAFKENFGHVMIPKGLDVPEALDLE
ncbi:unnamed protein product [Allacma fusca]|uniref:DM13 domain-containing protein n=1 Tax=Allacma fusca TaxID=39272 RepID=A0A8J2JAQ5_9HEXA|nr:unnamed protein product [Allacma fusca]